MKYVLSNLIILGCFCVLTCYAYGRAASSNPMHTVDQRPTAEPDMEPVSGKAISRSDIGYSKKDVKSLSKLYERIEKEQIASHQFKTMLQLYQQPGSPNTSREERIALNSSLTKEQKQTILWGKFTRKGAAQ